jgi:hypothetical protein
MSTHTNHTPRSPLTLDDGLTIWRARDIYRVRRFVHSLVVTLLLLEGLAYASLGHWDLVLTVVPLHGLGLWALAWVLRRAGAGVRAGWHWLALVLLLGIGISGCEPMAREVARLHGIKVDPFPGPCAPESFQAGRCVALQHQGTKP